MMILGCNMSSGFRMGLMQENERVARDDHDALMLGVRYNALHIYSVYILYLL